LFRITREKFWTVAACWNEALQQASPKALADEEWGWLPKCDQAWWQVVQ
jgi:hypothetical protein